MEKKWTKEQVLNESWKEKKPFDLENHVGPVREDVWVMVKDKQEEKWKGPYRLVGVRKHTNYPFETWVNDEDGVFDYSYAKLYTPEPEPKKKEITPLREAWNQGHRWVYIDVVDIRNVSTYWSTMLDRDTTHKAPILDEGVRLGEWEPLTEEVEG